MTKKNASSSAKMPNIGKLILESDKKMNKKNLEPLVKETNHINEKKILNQADLKSSKTVIDRIKKFSPPSPVLNSTNSTTNAPTANANLASEIDSKLDKYFNLDNKNSSAQINSTVSKKIDLTFNSSGNTEKLEQTVITINNKFSNNLKESKTSENKSQPSSGTLADDVKVESNKVKDIIKSFNNIEKRTSISQLVGSLNNYDKYLKQQMQFQQMHKENSELKEKNETHTSISKLDTSQTADSLNLKSKTKLIINSVNKMKSNSSFIQIGKINVIFSRSCVSLTLLKMLLNKYSKNVLKMLVHTGPYTSGPIESKSCCNEFLFIKQNKNKGSLFFEFFRST